MAERLNGAGDEEPAERNAALIARMLGIEPPDTAPPLESEDPQRVRESMFSAIRVLMEAISAERPLVVAFEDIHWADEGMLDLIEHLARWLRGPVLLVCMARDELLDRRTDWAGGRRNVDLDLPRPALGLTRPRSWSSRSTETATATSWPGSPSARAATRCSRRRWSTASTKAARGPTRCPSRCTRCWPRASTRWLPSSAACSSRRRWWGRTSGRACCSPPPIAATRR